MRLLLIALASASAFAEPACVATSATQAPALVELYTSEGCNSCPPADRWLSRLPRDGSVIPLAFHVDYWDYLGWRDRFASAQFSERQRQQLSVNGSRFPYTPQVVVNGQDRRNWPDLRELPRAAAPLKLQLRRQGTEVVAELPSLGAMPLSGWWFVSQSGHRTPVKAGENRGATLEHDHVVVQQQRLGELPAGTNLLRFTPQSAGDVTLVLTDARSGKPLQALRLSCPA
jgi:hypothetical protein